MAFLFVPLNIASFENVSYDSISRAFSDQALQSHRFTAPMDRSLNAYGSSESMSEPHQGSVSLQGVFVIEYEDGDDVLNETQNLTNSFLEWARQLTNSFATRIDVDYQSLSAYDGSFFENSNNKTLTCPISLDSREEILQRGHKPVLIQTGSAYHLYDFEYLMTTLNQHHKLPIPLPGFPNKESSMSDEKQLCEKIKGWLQQHLLREPV